MHLGQRQLQRIGNDMLGTQLVVARQAKRTTDLLAWKPSIDSIAAETFAASRSSPFPCDTESEREFGRTDITTGMPIVSSPVTFARRVMPIRGRSGLRRASVSAGVTVRCVPEV